MSGAVSNNAVGLTVVAMQRRHLRAVMAIDTLVYPRPWSRRVYLAEMSTPKTRQHIVALIGSRVVGHAGLLVVDSDAHVTTVAVDPACQRRGVGRGLMLALAAEALARDARAMTLEVRASNTAAISLYRDFGFAPAGLRRAYYPDDGEGAEDAIVMWAEGIDSPAYLARLAELANREAAVR